MNTETKVKVYGYEGYDIKFIRASTFSGKTESWETYYSSNWWYCASHNLCVDQNILANARFTGENTLAVDIVTHPELLKTAKRVYVHPNCNISRDMVRKKYQRCLNIAAADAVIIPDSHKEINMDDHVLLFTNDETMELFICSVPYYKDSYHRTTYPYYNYINTYDECIEHPGIRLGDIYTICMDIPKEILDARLVYAGNMAQLDNKNLYLLDYLTMMLPNDRLVCENDLLKTLGDETNKPTFESMLNIYDMMKSDDKAIRELGFKTLATMDYIHYPETVRFVLLKTNWYFNNNYKPSSIRFMLDSLKIRIRRRNSIHFSNYISQEDWDVLKPLVMHILEYDERQFGIFCNSLPCAYRDEEGIGKPYLIQNTGSSV